MRDNTVIFIPEEPEQSETEKKRKKRELDLDVLLEDVMKYDSDYECQRKKEG